MLQEFDEWSKAKRLMDDTLLQTAYDIVTSKVSFLQSQLRHHSKTFVMIHPCFTDIHRDHVLFDGDRLTGIIDFGAVKLDHPACDLARLFDDQTIDFHHIEKIYDTYRPGVLTYGIGTVIRQTAPFCNLAVWLLRLLRDRESPTNLKSVRQRIESLLIQCRTYGVI
jgi:thiamine kinase-like enzyme